MKHGTKEQRGCVGVGWTSARTTRAAATFLGTVFLMTAAACSSDDPPALPDIECDTDVTETLACGPTNDGTSERFCHAGRWVTSPCVLADGRCLDDEARPATCSSGEAGTERCVGGAWVSEQVCTPLPNGGVCRAGERDKTTCGWNQRGEQALICDDTPAWQLSGPCDDPDECKDGKTQGVTCLEFGVQQQRCDNGSWLDVGTCEEPCPRDQRQTEPCGFNMRGTQEFLCTGGAWQPQGACDDPDICENGASGIGDCALSDLGEAPQTCSNGRWDAGICKPLRMVGSTAPVGIAAYTGSRCALRRSGRVVCWGDRTKGIRGTGDNPESNEPTHLVNVTDAIDVALGFQHGCIVHKGGAVSCWGNNTAGQVGPGAAAIELAPRTVAGVTQAVAVAAGFEHSCALLASGAVHCWGNNSYGQLGDGSTVARDTPAPVSSLSDAAALYASGNHTCAILTTGRAMCWGRNVAGQLGDGTTTDRSTPNPVSGLEKVTALALSRDHSCAIANKRVQCWGSNGAYAVGHPTEGAARLTPWTISAISHAVDVVASLRSTCALTNTGDVYCWGTNTRGEHGNGETPAEGPDSATHIPQKVQQFQKGVGLTSTTTGAVVVVGATHCALNQTGALFCWGINGSSLLGKPTPNVAPFPTAVTIPPP